MGQRPPFGPFHDMTYSLRNIRITLERMRARHLALPALIGLFAALSEGTWSEAADTIYFKDGMRTVCEGSAWEKGDEIHCEYDGGLLIYPKSDVVRIEKGRSPQPEADAKNVQDAAPPPNRATPSVPVQTPGIASPTTPHRTAGIAFYDPRRPKKYWTSETRHHDSFRDAIAALSEEFDRPAAWVEENMGDSNDLNDIREILARSISGSSAAAADPSAAPEPGMEFYNPRRAKKYMTGPDARYDSFQEAVEALARELGKPSDWVERNMGDSNDVDQIRKSLRKNAQEAGMNR